MWLFLKGYVSLSLAAPSLSSPILNTLTISAAELFHGFRTFFMPPLTRGTLLARLGMLALPPGPLVPSPLCPLLLPLASSPRGERRRFALALAGCPLLPALRGPRCVPPTVNISCGLCLFTSGGARAPRPDGGGPPGRSLESTSHPLGRARSSWATLRSCRFLCPREPLS